MDEDMKMILLFGGMFLVYAVYRQVHTAEFHEAGKEMSVFIGAANTIILLTSSLTMALAISEIEKGRKVRSVLLQAATVLLGAGFLANKYFEWSDHIRHHIYPGSPVLAERGYGDVLFFGLYFFMTGLHALHVIIGIIVIAVIMTFIYAGRITPVRNSVLENGALYWHLVDMVRIFLFPLFYLIT